MDRWENTPNLLEKIVLYSAEAEKLSDDFFEYLSAVSNRSILFFLSILVLASCERWEDYRARWVGSFSGQVELHSQYPSTVGGNWIMFDTSYTQDWVIHVEMDGDSSLLMTGTRAGEVANFGTVQVPPTGAFCAKQGEVAVMPNCDFNYPQTAFLGIASTNAEYPVPAGHRGC